MCKTTVFKEIISFSVVGPTSKGRITTKQLFVYMTIARMNAMLDNSCYRYSYLARLSTGKNADCSIWSDRNALLWFAIHSIVTVQKESNTVNTKHAIGTVDAQMKDFESDYKISRDTSPIAQKHQHLRYMYQGLWLWAYFQKSDRPHCNPLNFDVKKLYRYKYLSIKYNA